MDKKFKATYSLSKYNNNLNNVSSNKDLRYNDAVYSNKDLGISLTCSQELLSLFEKTQGGKGLIVIDDNTIKQLIEAAPYIINPSQTEGSALNDTADTDRNKTELLGANNTDSDHS